MYDLSQGFYNLDGTDKTLHKDEYKQQKEFECTMCGEKQTTASGHRKHMILHEEEKLKFECEVCKKKFAFNCYLKWHMNVHTDNKPYTCPTRQCNAAFKLKQSLQRHMVVHSGIEFTCTVCGKKFTQKHYLTDHLNNTHGELKLCHFYWNGCTFRNKHRNILNPHENSCPFNPL